MIVPLRRGRLAMALLLAATLGACASAPDNPMTAQQRQSLRIDQIAVEAASDVDIWWGAAERDFAASKGCEQETAERRPSSEVASTGATKAKLPNCDYDELIETPEARAYLKARAADQLERILAQKVQPGFTGSAPAKLSVLIRQVYIVSGTQAMIFGGTHILRADFEVTDLASNRRLARYEDLTVTAGYGPGGVISLAFESASRDPYSRLSLDYAEAVNEWLEEEG